MKLHTWMWYGSVIAAPTAGTLAAEVGSPILISVLTSICLSVDVAIYYQAGILRVTPLSLIEIHFVGLPAAGALVSVPAAAAAPFLLPDWYVTSRSRNLHGDPLLNRRSSASGFVAC